LPREFLEVPELNRTLPKTATNTLVTASTFRYVLMLLMSRSDTTELY